MPINAFSFPDKAIIEGDLIVQKSPRTGDTGVSFDNGLIVSDGAGNLIANSFIGLTATGLVTSVLAYGAVGNGVHDDTTQINNAVAAVVAAGGGTLYFPSGTYITTGIDIGALSGNLYILGEGWSSIIKLKNGANGYIIKNTTGQQQGTRISNIKLDCNGANQTNASGGIYGYKYRRCLMDFVWVHNPWQAGIYLIGDSGDFGYQNRIGDCYIEGGMNTTSGVNAYGNGLRIENTDENSIYANHFENNGNFNDSTYGFHIYDKNGLSTYFGNSFVNGMGVFKLDGLQSRIIGNVFDGNGGACVQANGSATQTFFIGNTVLNVGYRASGGSNNSINGIYLNATQCEVSNNWFQSSAGSTPYTNSFVNIDTGATYSLIEHNTFNVPTGSGTLSGVITYVSGNPTGCRVRFNNGYDAVNSVQTWVTEKYGSASITSGNTSIAVNHGLSATPSINQISVTPQTSWGSAAKFWISNPTSSQFTINVNADPTQTVTFSWSANIGY